MIKRMILMLLAMLVLVGGVIGYKLFGRHMMNAAMAGQKPPPAAVSATEARELEWQPSLHAVGSFCATQGIMVSAQLDGAVTKIAFEPGALVTEGQLLVQQDISTELAQLESAQAGEALAAVTLQRAKELRERGSNAQSELDAAIATQRQARATIAAIQSTIDKKTIRAPFAGRAGIRQANLGQFLRSGAAIVPLQALDPIFFNFSLPQQNAADVSRGQPVVIAVDAFPDRTFTGEITAVNPSIDEATRTLQLQATLQNADTKLQPGMFGSVEVNLPPKTKVVTVPLAAIVYNPYGNAVYLVESAGNKELTVRQQFVQTGAKRGDQIAITKGVRPGDRVVTAGQLKLRNGSSVVINNVIATADAIAPRPDHP